MPHASRLTLPFLRDWGADPLGDGRWRFSLWAPDADSVAVEVAGRRVAMQRYAQGFWRVHLRAAPGDGYVFHADGQTLPDPAARAQAGGVDARSVLVDPSAHRWDAPWTGRDWDEAVIYELHLGTFTAQGTFAAAAEQLPRLAALGITCIGLMPVGQFPGRHGWGYDGVLPYAVHPAYGTPDDMKRFVAAAQAAGMMVLLDVVYNHFGPQGFHLPKVAPVFASGKTAWGDAIDYTRPPLRRFFIQNALYWLQEYRLDGLRLDATDQIRDPSSPHLLVDLSHAVQAFGFDRPIHLTTEDARNITRLHDGPAPLYTAEWNDDYHHALHCLLTGEAQGYYATFARDPLADLCLALAEGYVEQGQPRPPATQRRGQPSAHLPPGCFIDFNQNHDQTGNRARGERLITLAGPDAARIAHALLLMAPHTPLLFMGEEFGCQTPFVFFCDYDGPLADTIRQGRRAEFPHGAQGDVPDPNDPASCAASRPERPADAARWEGLTRELLSLRASVVVPLVRSGRSAPARAAPCGPRSLVADWCFAAGRLRIAANLGAAPDDPASGLGGAPAFRLGDLATDPFAIALWVAA